MYSIQLSCTNSRVGEQDGWCTIEFQDGFVKQAWHQVIATLEEEPSATHCADATGVAQAHEPDKQEQTPEPKSVTDARFATPVNKVAAAAGTPQMLAHIEAAPDEVTQAVDHVQDLGKRRATRSAVAKDAQSGCGGSGEWQCSGQPRTTQPVRRLLGDQDGWVPAGTADLIAEDPSQKQSDKSSRLAAATIHTEPDSWDCSRCTFTNTGGVRCEMCRAKVIPLSPT